MRPMGITQTRMRQRPRVRDPRRSPADDLPLDQLVQHIEASQQPQRHPTTRVGTAIPSSVITTRPPNGESAKGRLVEGQVTTNWKQALEQLALVYPDRINPHI